jgi:hypothetical protein
VLTLLLGQGHAGHWTARDSLSYFRLLDGFPRRATCLRQPIDSYVSFRTRARADPGARPSFSPEIQSFKLLRQYLENSPTDTPAWIKANAELNRKYTLIGLIIAAIDCLAQMVGDLGAPDASGRRVDGQFFQPVRECKFDNHSVVIIGFAEKDRPRVDRLRSSAAIAAGSLSVCYMAAPRLGWDGASADRTRNCRGQSETDLSKRCPRCPLLRFPVEHSAS